MLFFNIYKYEKNFISFIQQTFFKKKKVDKVHDTINYFDRHLFVIIYKKNSLITHAFVIFKTDFGWIKKVAFLFHFIRALRLLCASCVKSNS